MPNGEESQDATKTTGANSLDRNRSPDDPSKLEASGMPGIVPPEVLAGMPPDVRSTIEQFSVMMRSGPLPDPLRQKITSQHITDIIAQTGEDHRREFDLDKHGRYMSFSVLALILLFVLTLYTLFRDKPEAVQPILTHLIAFAGGIGGGMALRGKRTPPG